MGEESGRRYTVSRYFILTAPVSTLLVALLVRLMVLYVVHDRVYGGYYEYSYGTRTVRVYKGLITKYKGLPRTAVRRPYI